MSNEFMNNTAIDREKTRERTAVYMGRLGDLGLGNPKGIPSEYADKSDKELQEIAERLADKLIEPTDLTALSCIDGRERLGNADGSAVEIRLHRAGATSPNLAVALNADASVVDTLDSSTSINDQARTIDEYVATTTGFSRSAHLGHCGKADGEAADNEIIHAYPEIMTAVKYVLEMPAVREYLIEGHEGEVQEDESLFDETLAGLVQANAGKTEQYLKDKGWNGEAYVEDVKTTNPRGVEDLKTNHDHPFNGHEEPWYAIVIGDKTLNEGFVMNLKVVKKIAEALSGQRGAEGYKQALIAGMAEELSVGKRLPSDKTPAFLIGA